LTDPRSKGLSVEIRFQVVARRSSDALTEIVNRLKHAGFKMSLTHRSRARRFDVSQAAFLQRDSTRRACMERSDAFIDLAGLANLRLADGAAVFCCLCFQG
jgi:hypothetical protein